MDIIKARLQTGTIPSTSTYTFTSPLSTLRGAAPPLLTYGALNALLFTAYNRSLPYLPENLTGIFTAGALAGLATFTISAPTEVTKCRAQLSAHHKSSAAVAMELVKAHGIRGLYLGGAVTALRDSVGYGAYFATYEAVKPAFAELEGQMAILAAGGVAGVATWASIYPLDVVKTRVQTQVLGAGTAEGRGLLSGAGGRAWHGGFGARECARMAWMEGGARVFFDGMGVW